MTGGSLNTARLCIHQIIETSSVAGSTRKDTHLEILMVLLVFGPQPDSRLVLILAAYGQQRHYSQTGGCSSRRTYFQGLLRIKKSVGMNY